MPTIARPLLAAALALASIAGTGCVINIDAHERVTAEWDEPIDRDLLAEATAVRVRTDAGDIELEHTDGRPQLVATIRMEDKDRLDRVTIRQTLEDGVLIIEPDWDGQRLSNESCDFWMRLPDIAAIELHTSAGDLELRGFEADAALTTSAGDIEIASHSGPLDIESSAGDIEVDDASGPITASTSAGDIELLRVGWPVEARTSAGDIEVRFRPGFDGVLDLRTRVGSVEIDGDELQSHSGVGRSAEMAVGDAEHRSELRTSAGDIEVVFSGPPAGDDG